MINGSAIQNVPRGQQLLEAVRRGDSTIEIEWSIRAQTIRIQATGKAANILAVSVGVIALIAIVLLPLTAGWSASLLGPDVLVLSLFFFLVHNRNKSSEQLFGTEGWQAATEVIGALAHYKVRSRSATKETLEMVG